MEATSLSSLVKDETIRLINSGLTNKEALEVLRGTFAAHDWSTVKVYFYTHNPNRKTRVKKEPRISGDTLVG